jgi:sortase A
MYYEWVQVVLFMRQKDGRPRAPALGRPTNVQIATKVRPGACLHSNPMSGRRRVLREVLHFVASVLMTSGVLLLVDAVLTVTWQEPVSAYRANREQNKLDNQLQTFTPIVQRDKLLVAGERDDKKRLAKLARLQDKRTKSGEPIGKIKLERLHKTDVVVEGTDLGDLRKGPGHYPKTTLPGEGGTVAVAGHRTTYGAPFRDVDRLKPGDAIVMDMPYGRFTYSVDRTKIVPPTATYITRRVGHEQLVLSACHPLYSAAKRIVVFARLTRSEPK